MFLISLQRCKCHAIKVAFQEFDTKSLSSALTSNTCTSGPFEVVKSDSRKVLLSIRALLNRRPSARLVKFPRLQRLSLPVVHHFAVLHLLVLHAVLFRGVLSTLVIAGAECPC